MRSPALQSAAAAVGAAAWLLAVQELQRRAVGLQLALALRLVLEALQELRLQLAVSQAWALAAAACCFRCCQLLELASLAPQALALG